MLRELTVPCNVIFASCYVIVMLMFVRPWLLRQVYIFRVVRAPFVEEFYQCVTYGAYTEQWQEQLYSCLSVLLMYAAPLITMLTAYMLIFATIARKSRDFQPGNYCRLNYSSLRTDYAIHKIYTVLQLCATVLRLEGRRSQTVFF